MSLSFSGIGTCCSAVSRGSSGGGRDCVPRGEHSVSTKVNVQPHNWILFAPLGQTCPAIPVISIRSKLKLHWVEIWRREQARSVKSCFANQGVHGSFVVKNCIYFTTNGRFSRSHKKGKGGCQARWHGGTEGQDTYSASCAFLSRLT